MLLSNDVVSPNAALVAPDSTADGVPAGVRLHLLRKLCLDRGFARARALRVGLLIAGLGLAGGAARYYLVRHGSEETVEVHGVALGMTPSDVRSRFDARGPGVWRSEMRAEPVLVWTPSGTTPMSPSTPTTSATFEFHRGILVAVRLLVHGTDRAAQGRSLDVQAASVLVRRVQADGRVEVTLLARDCPTHAEEVRRLMRGR